MHIRRSFLGNSVKEGLKWTPPHLLPRLIMNGLYVHTRTHLQGIIFKHPECLSHAWLVLVFAGSQPIWTCTKLSQFLHADCPGNHGMSGLLLLYVTTLNTEKLTMAKPRRIPKHTFLCSLVDFITLNRYTQLCDKQHQIYVAISQSKSVQFVSLS
jgi:hypothetical protein